MTLTDERVRNGEYKLQPVATASTLYSTLIRYLWDGIQTGLELTFLTFPVVLRGLLYQLRHPCIQGVNNLHTFKACVNLIQGEMLSFFILDMFFNNIIKVLTFQTVRNRP